MELGGRGRGNQLDIHKVYHIFTEISMIVFSQKLSYDIGVPMHIRTGMQKLYAYGSHCHCASQRVGRSFVVEP